MLLTNNSNRGIISLSIAPLISGWMCLIELVVHSTHILVHPRGSQLTPVGTALN